MSLKEQLAEKKAALAALKDGIEAGNEEDIKSGEEIATAIDELTGAIEKAEKANALLGRIGSKSEESEEKPMNDSMKSLIEQAKAIDKNTKGWSASAEINFKDRVYTDTITGVQLADIDKDVVKMARRAKVADLFGALNISGNALTYFTRDAWVKPDGGAPAAVSENSKKPQLSTGFTPATVALGKIAGFVKESDEILQDAPFLTSVVENDLLYELDAAENASIVASLLGLSGAQTADYTDGGNTGDAANLVEGILYAARMIKQNTPFNADFVLMNPADLYALLTAKDNNHQYLGGGYFQNAYGNGDYVQPARIWGLPIYENANVTQGKVIVGAGKQSIKIARKGGTTVKVYEQNEDDALYNRVTVIAEERMAFVPKYPAGICILSKAVSA